MNYGEKLRHILLAAAGMMICIIGIAYKTGYFTGPLERLYVPIVILGVILAVIGLAKMKND